MSDDKPAPHHDCPPCPECSAPVATPFHDEDANAATAHLYCPACGHDWIEKDAAKIAQAWRARDAWFAMENR